MKKLKYTLIELLISMSIFVVMMGILMSTFSMAADIASSETTKINILQDANIFYSYLTRDFKSAIASPIPHPQLANGTDGDPDFSTHPAVLEDYGLSVSLGATTVNVPDKIQFFGDITPYGSAMATELASSPDNELLLSYEYDSTAKKIYRNLYIVNTASTDFEDFPVDRDSILGINSDNNTDGENAAILEGVESFNIVLWRDYEGGDVINTPDIAAGSYAEVDEIPTCITFYITLSSPNPNASAIIKERGQRTISKTIYLN